MQPKYLICSRSSSDKYSDRKWLNVCDCNCRVYRNMFIHVTHTEVIFRKTDYKFDPHAHLYNNIPAYLAYISRAMSHATRQVRNITSGV